MRPWILGTLCLLVAAAAFSASGCHGTCDPCRPTTLYRTPSSPAAVLFNLPAAVAHEDSIQLESCLASDFTAGSVVPPLKSDSVTSRAAFVDWVVALFRNANLELTIDTVASSPDPNPHHDGWIRYLVQTDLWISKPDGSTDGVVGPAVMLFHEEPAASGVWKLAEWDGQPTSSRPTLP